MDNYVIGERIKELRTQKGMTQQELAQIIGITYTSISYWESGKSKPDIFQIQKLADYFNVTIDYIYGKDNDDLESKLQNDKELRTLFRKAVDLNDEKKGKLNNILKASINALWDEESNDKESKS
jgi:transcriptional regulator with XRE-family HTH domain